MDHEFGQVYCWEIANGAPITQMKTENKMRQIRLLSKDLYPGDTGLPVNRAPGKVIGHQLNVEEAAKRITFIGMNPQKGDWKQKIEDENTHD